jgi:diaminopimelate decarboxylase
VSAATSHSRASRSAGVVDPASYTPEFSYRGSQLYCEGVSIAAAAKRFGTPAYLYSRASIEQAFRRMDSAFGKLPHTICYAIKANSNLGILRVFAALGSGFDIVSGGELYRLRRIGVPGNQIVFSGVGKSREEIREGLRARILLFNVESPAELDLLVSEASKLRVRAAASIRVNPDVIAGGHPHIATGHHRHKFGIDWETARGLYLQYRDSRWIDWQGISAHIGSQILTLLRTDALLRVWQDLCASLRARASRSATSIAAADSGFAIRRKNRRKKRPGPRSSRASFARSAATC